MKNIIILTILLILVTGCSTLEVDIDYDTAYNFDKKMKYSILYSSGKKENTLTNDRIVKALKNALNTKNFIEVSQENADLIFAMLIP